MRLPRLILNPSIRPWILLWQRERQETARLRRELRDWQNKYLQKTGTTPLAYQPSPMQVTERPPIGATEKRMRVRTDSAIPSTEDILLAADKAKSNGHQ